MLLNIWQKSRYEHNNQAYWIQAKELYFVKEKSRANWYWKNIN